MKASDLFHLNPQNVLAARPGKNELLIVGIGTSAGGVQALQTFFEHVPADSGMAYVVILHLSPNHDSKLAEVLQHATQMPVVQITQKTKVAANHVYVIPSDRHLTMSDGHILVTQNIEQQDRRAPVDIFFRTLAASHGPSAVCVILSGTGANGSMGLKHIKEMGGAAFVQNPREAEYNEMPRNAIATDLVDEVLPVAEIPTKIIAYRKGLGTVEIPVEAEKRAEEQQQALREIFTQLRLRTGHDFSNYKRPTLLRRIERRINIRNLPSLPAYAAYLQHNPEEINSLLKDLLISVTNFFRDKKAFEVIEQDIIPSIIKKKKAEEQLRIWVAGCATGEEAYSLAMICAEKTLGVIDAPKIQIFATDIDEAAIAHAREGFYTINDSADVSPERLRRFFNKEGDGYRIRREIREMILFANHNFIKDPPFSHLDLISCRNVLIYLNQTAQERVMETFHFALSPGGYLFLGLSESAESANDLYVPYNREYHIFQSRQVAIRTYPVPDSVPSFNYTQPSTAPMTTAQEQQVRERVTLSDLHQRLLEQYAPPSLVVNEEYDIIHLSERAGRYLQITGGEPSQNLLKLVRPELRLELRSALYQAMQRQSAVEARGLKVTVNDHSETLNIHIKPVFREGDITQGLILVVFERSSEEAAANEVVISSNEPVARQLEEELMRLKAQLRASIEQHEFQAEELKASNEELQAMNEELRSAAEELETSKEELQSINEELRTVNQELKVKVEETTLASNNLQNLINSVDFGTIFLDRSLRVALFTPPSRSLFNLIPNDIGRPLSDITNKLEYNDLIADAETVLDKLHTIERAVKAKDGRQFLLRILPYRTEEDRINGVVITFFDITERKNSEEALRKSEENFRVFFTASSDALYKMSPDWSEMYDLKGMNFLADTETPSRSWLKTYIPAEEHAKVLAFIQHAIQSKSIFELEHKVIKADGKIGWAFSRAVPLLDTNNEIIDWFGVASDVTKRKQTEEALRESTERLRITLESATDYAIITLDTEGKIQSWSRGAEVIFGYTENEVIGINAAMFNTPEDRAVHTLEKEIKQAADKGRAVDERWHLRKDGTRFFTIGVMTPIISDNKLVGFVIVARDMTEQKLVEQQKDEFIGIASHELKTPITSIKIYAETLQEKFEEAADKENSVMMQKLNNQVDRLTALIRDLLDTTKIFEGKLLLHTEKFDLNKLIDDRIEEWQRISPNHVIRLMNDKEITVSADKERISQVLTNFISNAIKYSPKGGDITIRTEEEGSNVKVSVQDHGIGIPKELVNYIFNRFYRVSNLQTHNYPGMGLGLYISAGIIKRHGGTIGVESIEGDGSTFYFTLPAKK